MFKIQVSTLMALIFALPLVAQTTATISGTVSDQGGGAMAGVSIVITNMDTQQERDARTDASGRFYAPALGSGRYNVAANSPGFEQVVQPGVTLTVGREQVINFTLKPSQVSERIEVRNNWRPSKPPVPAFPNW